MVLSFVGLAFVALLKLLLRSRRVEVKDIGCSRCAIRWTFCGVRSSARRAATTCCSSSSASRAASISGATTNPDGRWVAQQARNLSLTGALGDITLLIRDRDSKFTGGFDEVFRTEGIAVIQTPFRSPQANAHAEGFVRTAAHPSRHSHRRHYPRSPRSRASAGRRASA